MVEGCRTGYFQFDSRNDGLYIIVYPPQNGGRTANIDDVMYYLDKKKIECDTAKLAQAVRAGSSTKTELKVSDEKVHQYSEFGDYRISADCMKVEAVFYPPFVGGGVLTSGEIIKDLQYLGVKHGIDNQIIEQILSHREYGEAYKIAVGTQPRDGSDGYIEYKFNTELKPRPKMNDDGTVDFHTLENINHVNKGDVVAVLHKEDRGDDGIDVLEIVGTGGDCANSFNISTTSGIVAAAAGVPIAKHGNRAASSLCGTADCLEALGVNIQQSPKRCIELLNEAGMCFFFAQKYHTSMKYVGPIRKELGFRTVFNILGPLTNPGSPKIQLLGVYDEYLVEPLAQVLINLGVKRGMVVYGKDKLDEISMSAPTAVCEFKDGWFRSYTIAPEDFGFKRCTKEDLKGGTPEENAKITRDILGGAKGHKRNAVLMNAGAALYIGGKAETLKDGIALAAEIIDSGKALETLDKLIKVSNRPEEE